MSYARQWNTLNEIRQSRSPTDEECAPVRRSRVRMCEWRPGPEQLCFCLSTADFPTVKELKVWPEHGQMWVEWTAPSSKNASEFVVEWESAEGMDWQRESRGARRAAIKGTGGFPVRRANCLIDKWLCSVSVTV